MNNEQFCDLASQRLNEKRDTRCGVQGMWGVLAPLGAALHCNNVYGTLKLRLRSSFIHEFLKYDFNFSWIKMLVFFRKK